MENEVLKTILQRRSVRAFSEKQISDSELQLIIKAGLYAPSAMNEQNWHFTVVQNKELIDDMSYQSKAHGLGTGNDHIEKMMSNPKLHIFYNAPTVIVASTLIDGFASMVNTSAAIQNMLLAAHSLGIGSCWIGLSRYLFNSELRDEYQKRLNIPVEFLPNYCIALGYPKGNLPEIKPRLQGTVNYVK